MLLHARCHRGTFYHGTLRCQVAKQDGQAAGGRIGVTGAADDVAVYGGIVRGPARAGCQVFRKGLACAGKRLSVQEVHRLQLVHDGTNAARIVQIFNMLWPGGCELDQVRRACSVLVQARQSDLNTRLMSDGEEMEHGVG